MTSAGGGRAGRISPVSPLQWAWAWAWAWARTCGQASLPLPKGKGSGQGPADREQRRPTQGPIAGSVRPTRRVQPYLAPPVDAGAVARSGAAATAMFISIEYRCASWTGRAPQGERDVTICGGRRKVISLSPILARARLFLMRVSTGTCVSAMTLAPRPLWASPLIEAEAARSFSSPVLDPVFKAGLTVLLFDETFQTTHGRSRIDVRPIRGLTQPLENQFSGLAVRPSGVG